MSACELPARDERKAVEGLGGFTMRDSAAVEIVATTRRCIRAGTSRTIGPEPEVVLGAWDPQRASIAQAQSE